MTCANYAPPLGLSLENITVSSDSKAISRGIGIGIGSPLQIFSLRPSIGDDNTWVFNAADCVSASNDSCIGLKGGVYNSSLSHTFLQTTGAAWNGTQLNSNTNPGSFIYFNDDLYFGSNGSSLGFPLLMDQPGQGTQSGLGIGPKSTFLDAAVKSGSAPSKAWGLWVGSRSVVNPADGALWIGGYDTNRVADVFTEFPVFDHCSTCVSVTNLTYEYVGGSASLFSNSSQTLTVSLEPFQRPLEVPEDIFINFGRISNGTVGVDPGTTGLMTFPRNAELGNLSITLSNGYQTIIPAQELFFPPRNYNEDGVYTISNDTYVVGALSNSTVAESYVFSWGIPFLTMNYMIMDYENKTFKMAPARQGPYGISNGPLVQPLCKGVAEVTNAPVGSPGSTPTTTASPSASPPSNHSSTNVGAIAGGVVGGVVGVALIAALVLLILRGKRKQRALRQERDVAIAENARNEKALSYTTTSPDRSEVAATPSSPQTINQWLYSQHGSHQDNHRLSANMNAPFDADAAYEMPVERQK